MYPKKIEFRGCCMGIPIGCSSVFLLAIGAILWQYPPSIASLLTAVTGLLLAVITGAGVLIAVEWFHENHSGF